MRKFKVSILVIFFFVLLLMSVTRLNVYALIIFSIVSIAIIPIKKYWNNMSFMLLLFSIFYSLINIINGNNDSWANQISYIIAPVAFFRLGYYFMDIYNSNTEREKFFLFLCLFYLFPIFFITINNILSTGLINPSRQMLNDAGNATLSATLYGLMTSLGIGTIVALFIHSLNLKIRIAFILIALMSMMTVIHLVNRSGLVIFAVCLVLGIILSSKNKLTILFLSTLIILAGVLFSVSNNNVINSEITNAYAAREASGYSYETAGGRTELWVAALNEIFLHPFGWANARYAHNMWLDIARVSGIIAFIPFLIVSIMYIHKLIYLFHKHNNRPYIKILISISISTLLASFIEPVIDASILFFSVLMMLWGIASKIYSEQRYFSINHG